jgi:RNA polymerase sigma factor (sigma-70 family)
VSDSDAKRRITDWFRQWRSPLRKFLSGKVGARSGDLDDIAQEVFLRLLRYERAELVEHPQAYLFRIASNVAAEWSIRARVRHPHDAKWLESLRAESAPEDDVAQVGAQEEIERALNALAARERQALSLQFSEGLGYAEIAERMQCSRRTVKRIVIKSYQKLRLELSPDLLEAISHGRE